MSACRPFLRLRIWQRAHQTAGAHSCETAGHDTDSSWTGHAGDGVRLGRGLRQYFPFRPHGQRRHSGRRASRHLGNPDWALGGRPLRLLGEPARHHWVSGPGRRVPRPGRWGLQFSGRLRRSGQHVGPAGGRPDAVRHPLDRRPTHPGLLVGVTGANGDHQLPGRPNLHHGLRRPGNPLAFLSERWGASWTLGGPASRERHRRSGLHRPQRVYLCSVAHRALRDGL